MNKNNNTRSLERVSFFFIFLFSVAAGQNDCPEKRCHIHKDPAIRFPFGLRGVQPQNCRYSQSFDLSCVEETNKTLLELPNSVKLWVNKIDYKSQTIRLSDSANCLPRVVQNLNFSSSPFRFASEYAYNYTVFKCYSEPDKYTAQPIPSCLDSSSLGLYAVQSSVALEEMLACTKMYDLVSTPFRWFKGETEIVLKWSKPDCTRCESKGNRCGIMNLDNTKPISESCSDGAPKSVNMKLLISAAVIGPFFVALVLFSLYSMYRKHKMDQEIEAKIKCFLADYEALKPARYSYADIKRITNQFSEEIGQGAYGIVYKGKLSNEILVAVKVLNNAKPNGEEFINEVGIISRIHHVNVVRMVGFCAEGFRRALIYEFLPNGSLQELIESNNRPSSNFHGWKKMRNIATGIAKGIEYLHQGCEQRIVHFDIKPHNVLLDHDFNPKVSDFGTAKLCSRDQSKVSMTAARGTVGYIAPEVFSRNFGGVSYKSDVFSFGMLLLEMVGKNKNRVDDNSLRENTQFYLPEWIYERLEQGNDLEVGIEEEEDVKIVKSLAIVGLWCIQWQPVDRPSMSVVVKMIEGNEELQMPNNPFVKSPMLRKNNTQLELSVISESD